jgi:hypothetical protein
VLVVQEQQQPKLQDSLVLSQLFQIYLQLVVVVAQLKVHNPLVEVQVVVLLIVMLHLLEIHLPQLQLKDLVAALLVVHLVMEAVVAAVLAQLVKQEPQLLQETVVLE